MEITIKNLQKQVPISTHLIQKAVATILRREGVGTSDLSLVFVSDKKIKTLNQRYLQRSYATDVLAFDLRGSQRRAQKVKKVAGEIVISTDTVIRNSKIFKTTPRRELFLCIIHGILHLLGYDDHGALKTKRMRQKEKELLRYLSP